MDPFPLWVYKQINAIKCGRINKMNVTTASRTRPKQNIRYKNCCVIGKLIDSEHMEEAIIDNNYCRIVNLAIL